MKTRRDSEKLGRGCEPHGRDGVGAVGVVGGEGGLEW